MQPPLVVKGNISCQNPFGCAQRHVLWNPLIQDTFHHREVLSISMHRKQPDSRVQRREQAPARPEIRTLVPHETQDDLERPDLTSAWSPSTLLARTHRTSEIDNHDCAATHLRCVLLVFPRMRHKAKRPVTQHDVATLEVCVDKPRTMKERQTIEHLTTDRSDVVQQQAALTSVLQEIMQAHGKRLKHEADVRPLVHKAVQECIAQSLAQIAILRLQHPEYLCLLFCLTSGARLVSRHLDGNPSVHCGVPAAEHPPKGTVSKHLRNIVTTSWSN